MLVATELYKKYGDLEVLKNISLSINQAEVVSIVGASGAGKSTLLQILGTLDKPDQGHVSLNGLNLNSISGNKLAKIRNENLGFIFQFHNLMAELTALENVCLPAWIGKKDAKLKAEELLVTLGLKDRLHHLPSELSGGEQQRVAVARALVNSPQYIFADEPSGNLDTKNAEELHDLFFKLRDTYSCSFVIVTHNTELAKKSDRIFELQDGKMI